MATPSKKIRVLLVDDHALFRAGVRSLVERDLNVTVVAECESGDEAMAAIAEHRPDIAMLDISLRGEDGIDLARRIKTEYGDGVHCIMLSMHLSPEYVRRSFAAGAKGYVVKDAGPAELTRSITAVTEGGHFISASATGALVEGMQRGDNEALHASLSPRQLQVLCMVAEGKSTKAIARELALSTKTVDAHRYQISKRLNVHDAAGMVLYSIKHGLTQREPGSGE